MEGLGGLIRICCVELNACHQDMAAETLRTSELHMRTQRLQTDENEEGLLCLSTTDVVILDMSCEGASVFLDIELMRPTMLYVLESMDLRKRQGDRQS